MGMMKEKFFGAILLAGMIDEKDEKAFGTIITTGGKVFQIDDFIEYNDGSFSVCLLCLRGDNVYKIIPKNEAVSLVYNASKIIFPDGEKWQLLPTV